MSKILVVLTGGTIGSSLQHGIIKTDSHGCRCLEKYREIYGEDVTFVTVPLLNLLSENLQPTHWQIMTDFLLKKDLSDFDGVIITHGSDTLSYTSAFLGMVLCHLDKPIVITAADRIPDDPESNAVCNLRAAVVVIRHFKKGVFAVYKNPHDPDCSVFLATRIREADRLLDRFTSADGQCFGTVTNDSLQLTGSPVSPEELQTHRSPLPSGFSRPLQNCVMMVRPYPGMDYRMIQPGPSVRAVLHITYHSASACTEDNNSALTLLRQCRKNKIDFYLASFKKNPGSLYETSHLLLQEGAIPLISLTDEAAYAKLLLCYHLPDEQRIQLLKKDLYFEAI